MYRLYSTTHYYTWHQHYFSKQHQLDVTDLILVLFQYVKELLFNFGGAHGGRTHNPLSDSQGCYQQHLYSNLLVPDSNRTATRLACQPDSNINKKRYRTAR